MPTYEYRCNACEHEFELFQSMSARTKRKCPKCGKNALERLIGTGAAVIFKGSGFYETDYRSKSYKDAAKSEKEAGKKAETGSGTKSTETKGKAESAGKADNAGTPATKASGKPKTGSSSSSSD